MNDGGSQQGQQFTLTASKGMGGSRTAIINGQTVWSEGDKIYVSSKNGDVTGVLTLTSEPGEPTGTFSGFVFGNPDKLAYSVFPAPTDGTEIDLSTIVGGGEVDAPMIGAIKLDDDVDVQFENTCGVVLVDLPKAAGLELEIYAKDNNKNELSISAYTDVTEIGWDGNKPYLKFTPKANNRITITNSNGGTMYVPYFVSGITAQNQSYLSKVTFYEDNYSLIVNEANLLKNDKPNIVGSYVSENVKVHTYNAEGDNFNVTAKAETTVTETKTENGITYGKVETTITETQIEDATNNDGDNNGEGSTVSSDVAYFNVSASATTTGTNNQPIEVTEVKVTLPQVNSTTQKAEVSISHVAEDATITIVEKEEAGKNPIQELTVVLPSGTTKEEAKEQVVIEMPNTTVTVKSADGNVLIIKEMVAETADNTLVVEKDVEIKSLTIKKGNVQVFGKVGEIKRDPNNADEETVVTIEKGGIVNAVFGKDKIKVVDNNKPSETPESISVSDFTQLKSALKSQPQTEITLIDVTEHITLTEPLVINKRVQLNLGDKSLTIAENFPWDNTEAAIISNANLHISRGKIIGCKATAEGKNLLKSTEALNIFNVELITNGVSNGISQVNKSIIFTGNTSITATKGNAVQILINRTEPGINGVQLQANTIINGSVAFELTCEPVEKADVSICVLHNSKLNGKLDIIKNGFERYIRVENNNESGGAEGRPVANKEELEAALKDSKVTNIILTKPIEVNNLALRFKTLTLSPDIFEGSTADAAITVVSDEEAQICDGIIVGDINDANKYIVKSTAPTLGVLNATIEAKGGMNAVYVKDAEFVLNTLKDTQKVIPTIVTSTDGYALYLVAETSPVFANIYEGTTIGGTIHYYNNSYDGKDMSYLDIYGTINGHLTVDGQFKDALYKLIDNNAQIGEDFTGWPRTKVKVDNYEELKGYLNYNNPDNNLIREIIIAAPIEINVNGRLDLNLGFKKIKVIDGFWEKHNEAIILKKSPDAEYCSIDINGAATRYEIKGSTNAAGKYFIKSDSVGVSFNNGNLIMEGTLNAVFIKDSFCSLSGSKITTSEAGYAVDMNVSGTESEALLHLMNNSQIIGPIRYNFNTQDPGFDSTVKVEGNSTINGKLTVLGNIQRFKVVKVSGTIKGIGWLPYLPGDNTGDNEGEGGEDEGGTTSGNVTNGNTSGEGFKNGGEF